MAPVAKKKGPAKRWTRKAMIDAGIAHIKRTGELPTPSAWKYGSEANPTRIYVASVYGKNGWSTYLTTLRREFKKQTGTDAPPRAKPGRKPGQGIHESRYTSGPGTTRTLNRKNKRGELLTDAPEPTVDPEPVVSPEPPKKGWFARLFGG